MEQEEKEACEEDGANGIHRWERNWTQDFASPSIAPANGIHRGERNLQGEDAKENILITEDI